MIIIEEKPSSKLPNLTSLYFKAPFNETILKLLNQEPIKYEKNNTYEFPITRLFFLVNLFKDIDDVKFIPFYKQTKSLIKPKSKYKVKPYNYQLEGIEYGLNNDKWLLLDDQGLGKTLQMIYLAQELKETRGIEHCLVICGVNGLKYNWAREIEKFSDLSYTILGQRINRNGKHVISSVADRCNMLKNKIEEFFIITNKETLQSKEFLKAYRKSKNTIDMIVVDEIHKLKDPNSNSAKTLLKLDSKYKIALTGTIIMNVPENAYVSLRWTDNVKCTYGAFKSMYNVYGGFNGAQVIGFKNLKLLQEHIADCSLRRLKTDVLSDLPDRVFKIEYVELDNDQRKFYESVKLKIAEELDLLPARKVSYMQELTLNMRLRQATAWPGLLTSDNISSAKLNRLEELVEEIVNQGDKVVVFSTFKGTIKEIERRLSKYGVLVCTGDTSDYDISVNKDLFENDDSKKVLLGTWQKMGTGHTLTAANYLIFIDTPWTDADFQQASDRIYRIGQKKNVFIITLIAKDTYDERVQEIIDMKYILSGYLVDRKESDEFNLLQIVDYQA